MTRRPPAYHLTTDQDGIVVLALSERGREALGDYSERSHRSRRTYWVRGGTAGTGHVYETYPDRPGTSGHQVGDQLSHGGAMLCCRPHDLAHEIRREMRRALASLDRRETAR